MNKDVFPIENPVIFQQLPLVFNRILKGGGGGDSPNLPPPLGHPPLKNQGSFFPFDIYFDGSKLTGLDPMIPYISHNRIHGTNGISTYIYHANQPFM